MQNKMWNVSILTGFLFEVVKSQFIFRIIIWLKVKNFCIYSYILSCNQKCSIIIALNKNNRTNISAFRFALTCNWYHILELNYHFYILESRFSFSISSLSSRSVVSALSSSLFDENWVVTFEFPWTASKYYDIFNMSLEANGCL